MNTVDIEPVSSVSCHPSTPGGEAISTPRGKALSKNLYFTFPPQAKDHVKEHIINNGYGNSMINYHALKDNSSAVVVMIASVGDEIISKLNGSMIQGQYQLTVQPHVKKTRSMIQNTETSVTTSSPTKTISAEPYRVHFGSKLPEYVHE